MERDEEVFAPLENTILYIGASIIAQFFYTHPFPTLLTCHCHKRFYGHSFLHEKLSGRYDISILPPVSNEM